MGPLVAAAIAVALVVVMTAVMVARNLLTFRVQAAWQLAADRLGLRYELGRVFKTDVITGTIDGMDIQVDRYPREVRVTIGEWGAEEPGAPGGLLSALFGGLHTRVQVTSRLIPADLALSPESEASGAARVDTGDLSFDRTFALCGDEATALAVLDGATRNLLDGVGIELGLQIRDRTVSYAENSMRLRALRPLDPECRRAGIEGRIQAIVEALVEVAGALALDPDEIPALLSSHVQEEFEQTVRRRNMEVLADRYSEYRETADAAHAVLAEPLPETEPMVFEGQHRIWCSFHGGMVTSHAEVTYGENYWEHAPAARRWLRFVASSVLGAGGRRELIRLAGDREAPPELRAQVVRRLGAGRAGEAILGAVEETLGDDEPEVVVAALGVLGGHDRPSEGVLVDLLERDDLPVVLAAAEALGARGSASAVGALQRRAAGLLTESGIKEAARAAVGRIEARLGPVEPGRLSVAEDEGAGGGLSLSAEEGGLSAATAPRSDPGSVSAPESPSKVEST